jgi:hypothetical protein
MFAWCPADMPGIPRELAEHELKIFPNAKPIKQSMRCYNPKKARAMGEEIKRLLEAKFIREIKEATWLSPPVMVEKKDTKIYRMCIDFTALNKPFVPRHVLRVQPDKAKGRRRRQDGVHHPTRGVLLYDDALRAQKRGSHLSTVHAGMPEGADRPQHRSLC